MQTFNKSLITIIVLLCFGLVGIFLIHSLLTNAGGILEIKAHASILQPQPPAIFKWSMPKRFGPKRPNGIVDYRWDTGTRTYAKDYVNPKTWKVDFDACSLGAIPGSTFVWEIDGVALPNPNASSCSFSHEFAAQRTYAVKLIITASDGTQTMLEAPVTVKDLLLVSLGDSFASGQGNPDIRKRGSTAAQWVDKICARSAIAGPAQAALSIEEADPHTSVTFISFACTGAAITAGIMGEQTIGKTKLDAQIDKLKQALDGRPIDALIISIGGNDIGFADLVARCIFQPGCHHREGTLKKFTSGLGVLEARYQILSEKIGELPPVKKVFITEYPDLVRDEAGNLCHRKPSFDILRGISRDEAEWASEHVIARLNGKVNEAANRHGWVYVTGISDKFRTHGYCVTSEPERWVRTFADAKRIQSVDKKCDVGSVFKISTLRQCLISSGSVHPAEGGHAVYASRLIESLQREGVTIPPSL